MPVGEYFKGRGAKVLGAMKDTYGEEKGEKVFYATANKQGMNPKATKAKKLKESVGAQGAKRALEG